MSPSRPTGRRAPRTLLVAAAIAVGFAAADTYVVVLALPDMMASSGLEVDELQRAAPIVSGFLLGYIAMLPLIGRIADLRGRVPVLIGSLVVFSVGSLVTAASYDLVTMVVGRFLQGVGGGGLVPATLALVADIWVAEERGLPLGVVGAVQELGSVLGPLYGALVLAVSSWQAIFWINLAVGCILAASLLVLGRDRQAATQPTGTPDLAGWLLAAVALGALTLVLLEPDRLTSGMTTGLAFIPYFGDSRWSTPMALTCYIAVVLLLVRQLTASRPLVDLRGWSTTARQADLPGAALLGIVLAGIVLAFASADPEVQVLSPSGPWLLVGSAIAAGLFAWRQRMARNPLVPRNALRERAAWGALAVSFFVGAALIAALVDIPIFARITVYPDSQLGAALVLVRLLAALPVGALVGGYLIRRWAPSLLSATGMALAALGFVWMTTWGLRTLEDPVATTLPLVICGFGFGLAVAPVNAALLAATRSQVHGVASALLVVARMVGMLVGISGLTTIGLRRFYAVAEDVPPLKEVCGSATGVCDAYVAALTEAGIAQIHAIFWGAAVAALVAAILSAGLLRGPRVEGKGTGLGGFGL
ncbi:MAG: MFS transporter [Nocardioidaceae bacterium]|nr:MFS transporter [Nocardioidaceae bacterium]